MGPPAAQRLYEWVAQTRLEVQVEFSPSGPPHARLFTACCAVRGRGQEWRGQGTGPTKAQAKEAAAAALLSQLGGTA